MIVTNNIRATDFKGINFMEEKTSQACCCYDVQTKPQFTVTYYTLAGRCEKVSLITVFKFS